jgi:hypothetical protein
MCIETFHRSFWLMPTYHGRRGVRHLSDDALESLACSLQLLLWLCRMSLLGAQHG